MTAAIDDLRVGVLPRSSDVAEANGSRRADLVRQTDLLREYRLRRLRVRRAMTVLRATVDIDAPILEARRLMDLHHVTVLLVTDRGTPAGYVRREDLDRILWPGTTL